MRYSIIGTIISVIFLFQAGCAHQVSDVDDGDQLPSAYASLMTIYGEHLNHLESVRSGSCPMYPSCSEYSRQAIARYGFSKGWVMTMDRLLRCGRNELEYAQRVFIGGSWRYHDPVDNNDFWHAHR